MGVGMAVYVGWLITPLASFNIGYWVGWRDGKGKR